MLTCRRPRRAPARQAGPRAAPSAALRRPSPLTCLVLEADEGARSRAALYRPRLGLPHVIRGVVAFHGLPHRDLGEPAVPAHQLRGPLDRIADMNSLPISVFVRPSVHRWSFATRAPTDLSAAPAPAGPTAAGSAAPATPGPSTAAPQRRHPARPAATAAPNPR